MEAPCVTAPRLSWHHPETTLPPSTTPSLHQVATEPTISAIAKLRRATFLNHMNGTNWPPPPVESPPAVHSPIREETPSNQTTLQVLGPSDQSNLQALGPSDQSNLQALGPSDQSNLQALGTSDQSNHQALGPSDQRTLQAPGTSDQSNLQVRRTWKLLWSEVRNLKAPAPSDQSTLQVRRTSDQNTLQVRRTSDQSSLQALEVSGQQDLSRQSSGQTVIDVLDGGKRPRRSRRMKRFSSRWQSRSSTGSSNVPAHSLEKLARKKHCKLLGDQTLMQVSSTRQRQRYVTKDGKCQVNLGPISEKGRFLSDIFTTLVDLKYRWFLLVFSLCYILTWVAFGCMYFLGAWLRDDIAHMGDPQWKPCFEKVDGFLSALLLSLESQRTIGYGYRMVTAQCPEGVVLLMIQSILGSIIDALMVGCMFVKISRPQQRAQTLIFSKHCVICERDDKLCMLFRLGDLRESHMVDAKIRAKLIKSRQTKEGEFIPLEQSEFNLGYDTGGDRLLLVEPQTITHNIDSRSPFWDVSAERLPKESLEIIVILEGIVEASGMTCQARTSYTEDEILWGHRFESCISLEKEAFRVDYSAFDKTFEVQMSPESAKARSLRKESAPASP